METGIAAPWHGASFDRLLLERLPQLLASRLPLTAYEGASTGPHECRIEIAVAASAGEVRTVFEGLPRPDPGGVWLLEGEERVVVPVAATEELDRAEVAAAGEQVYEYLHGRLGEAPEELSWDAALLRAWCPLDVWFTEFLREHSEPLLKVNWLDRQTHLRRIRIREAARPFARGQIGRACPLETPEGRRMGRLLSVARGATLEDGRLVEVDPRPEMRLGLTASMVPFIEHSEAARLTMGLNLMRRWLTPPDPEPALVRTGREPDVPEFWCGRNLLTAFVAWDADVYWDGIVISESCATRFDYPRPIEPGDLLSNRYGYHGTVSRIVPDTEMPCLPDGAPVELIYSFVRLHTRMNFGQAREVLMGRIARAEGRPAVIPPFEAPCGEELRRRLRDVGLAETGMETLYLDGKPLERPSLAGWGYWGRVDFLARDEMLASTAPDACLPQGEAQYAELRELGAWELLREQFNTRAAARDAASSLPLRVSRGPVPQQEAPSPQLEGLIERLAAGGIRASLEGCRLLFRFEAPAGRALRLARPVPHPWLRDRELAEIGLPERPASDLQPWYDRLAAANQVAERHLKSAAPPALLDRALAALSDTVQGFFDRLLLPEHVRPSSCALFRGRAVIQPGKGLRHDQAGIPEDIAWTLFAPMVQREIGAEQEIAARTPRAAAALDGVMARSWVVVQHGLREGDRMFMAFHPVRGPEPAIRLPLAVCFGLIGTHSPMDVLDLFLPITDAAQKEAGDLLSVRGCLERDPGVLDRLAPVEDALWGLAELCGPAEGRARIGGILGGALTLEGALLTRPALVAALKDLLAREGADQTLTALDELIEAGFEAARNSGASMNPFFGSGIERPAPPAGHDPEAWNAWADQWFERVAARTDFGDPDLGPQLLAVKSGAAGSLRHLRYLLGALGTLTDIAGQQQPNRRSPVDGWTPDELFASAAHTRARWAEFAPLYERTPPAPTARGFTVLARARQARRPGIVFALAAATGEADPLTDVDSRLFAGLPPK